MRRPWGRNQLARAEGLREGQLEWSRATRAFIPSVSEARGERDLTQPACGGSFPGSWASCRAEAEGGTGLEGGHSGPVASLPFPRCRPLPGTSLREHRGDERALRVGPQRHFSPSSIQS